MNGFDVTGERDAVRRHIGLVFQDPTLGGYLTAEQNLRLHADLYDVDPGVIPARMRQMLEMVDLWGCRDQLTVAPVRRSSIVPAKCSR